MHSKSSS